MAGPTAYRGRAQYWQDHDEVRNRVFLLIPVSLGMKNLGSARGPNARIHF